MPQPQRSSVETDVTLRPLRVTAGAAIALVWVIVAISFYLDPSVLARSQVGRTIEPWDYIWNALYLIGGIAIIADRARRLAAIGAEILGVCLLASGWTINLLAVLYTQGFDVRILTYVVFIWWAYSRYQVLRPAA